MARRAVSGSPARMALATASWSGALARWTPLSFQYGDMKGDIGRQGIVITHLGCVHALYCPGNFEFVFIGGELGSQCRCARFDVQADLGELYEQPHGEFALKQPAKDVRVEKVPIMLGGNADTLSGAGRYQSLGDQHLDGFPYDRSRRAVMVAQGALAWKGSVVEPSGNDACAKVLNDGLRDGAKNGLAHGIPEYEDRKPLVYTPAALKRMLVPVRSINVADGYYL
jgi:hypothetical protein